RRSSSPRARRTRRRSPAVAAGGVSEHRYPAWSCSPPTSGLSRHAPAAIPSLRTLHLAPFAPGLFGENSRTTFRKSASEGSRKRRLLTLSPRRPGGEGRVRGGRRTGSPHRPPCVRNFWQSIRTDGCSQQPPVAGSEPVPTRGVPCGRARDRSGVFLQPEQLLGRQSRTHQ